jgi:recombination protein RecR
MSRLIEELRKLPGIGTKSAQRLAFHVLRSSDEDARALAHAIEQLKQHLRLCSVCNNITDVDPCTYCTNSTRNQRLICVLEEPTNIATIEKTRAYNGVYHILHGTLSPVNGVGPEQLRIANLLTRAAALTSDAAEPAEIILATSPTTEGEATANYIAAELHRLSRDGAQASLQITRIATGVPAGSDIEYADEVTISRAMEHRRAL